MDYVDSTTDTRCLETTEALLLDGANGVCSGPRHPDQWQTLPTVGIFIFVVAATALWSCLPSGRARKVLSFALAGAFLLSVAGGFHALLFIRADAPMRSTEIVRRVSNLTSSIENFYRLRHAVTLENRCLECLPALLFAQGGRMPHCEKARGTSVADFCLVPPHRDSSEPEGRIVLEKDAAHGDCRQTADQLVCGTAE